MIIGLTGRYASGKGEIAAYLRKKGFGYFSFSVQMEEECRKRGLEPTRENLINIANELREKSGNDYWAKKIIERLGTKKNYVVESFRNPEEVKAFKKIPGFFLLLVEAPQKKRFERTLARKRTADFKSFQEFKKFEEMEKKSKNKAAQQLEECEKMADLKIMNNGTLQQLHKKIGLLLKELRVQK